DAHGSEESADPGVEVFLMKAGNDHPAHPPVVHIIRPHEGRAAVHGDFVSLVRKARADLLGKALEAAIAVGDAASADNGDFHEAAFRCSLFALRKRQLVRSIQTGY